MFYFITKKNHIKPPHCPGEKFPVLIYRPPQPNIKELETSGARGNSTENTLSGGKKITELNSSKWQHKLFHFRWWAWTDGSMEVQSNFNYIPHLMAMLRTSHNFFLMVIIKREIICKCCSLPLSTGIYLIDSMTKYLDFFFFFYTFSMVSKTLDSDLVDWTEE